MFKPLPQNTTGVVIAAASRIATTLTVDAALYAKIGASITSADHTYLHIKTAGNTEIVRVDSIRGFGRIVVQRGIEGTRREAILANTPVYYYATVSSLYDQVREQISPISLTATGVAGVNPIYAPVIEISSNAGVEVTSDRFIHDGNYDPCKPFACPGYTVGPYLLTSQQYPIEVMEAMRAWGNITDLGGLWNVVDSSEVNAKLTTLTMTVTVAYRTYSYDGNMIPADRNKEYIKASTAIHTLDMTVTVAYRTYDIPQESSFGHCQLQTLDMTVVVAYITYSNYPTENIQAHTQITGLSLT